MKSVRVVILAKAPLPGFAKTRLIPALGEHGAANLAALMLEKTIHEAIKADIGPVELCVAPAPENPAWQEIFIPASVTVAEQVHGDLGKRMAHISSRVTANGEAVIMIGADCPSLTAPMLAKAGKLLIDNDAVMVPALDGGYVLIGLNHHEPSVFSDIHWSNSSVTDETRQRIQKLGWQLEEMPPLHDIDEPADLKHLPESIKIAIDIAQGDNYA